MSNICKKCNSVLSKRYPGLQCTGFCGNFFHANTKCSDVNKECLNLLRSMPGTKWVCVGCRVGKRNSLIAADPEVDVAGNSDDDRIDTSVARDVFPTSQFQGSLNKIESELILLRQSVTFCSDKVSDFEATLVKLNDYIKLTDKLKEENHKLRSEVVMLNSRVNDLEQFSRLNNLEIVGVSERKDENLYDIAQNIANTMDFDLSVQNIEFIHRVQTRNSEGKPKNIIMKLTSRKIKENFLNTAKAKRKADGGHILKFRDDRIFINEHLTNENKVLFSKSREFAKEKHYKFVWVRNGHVFLRKDERSKIIQVKTEETFSKLR